MANKKRVYYTIKMGGKNRTMHFSMNFWSNFTDDLNIPLDKLGEIFTEGVSLSTVRSLIYSALLANDQENKNLINYDKFDCEKFKDSVFDDLWEEKELKDRMHHIASVLNDFLPNDYELHLVPKP